MNTRIASIAVAIGVALPVLSGCGGGDAPIEPVSTSTTDSAAATISQADFLTSADPRCAEANAAVANLSSSSSPPSATTVAQQLSITQGVLSGLQGLGDAEDPDGSLADYYAAIGDEIRVLKSQEAAATSGDLTAASALDSELAAAQGDAETAAAAYGFNECGQSGSAIPDTVPGTTAPSPSTDTPAPTTTAPAPTTPAPAPVTPETPPVAPPTGGGGGTPTPPAPDGSGSSGSSGGSGGITPG